MTLVWIGLGAVVVVAAVLAMRGSKGEASGAPPSAPDEPATTPATTQAAAAPAAAASASGRVEHVMLETEGAAYGAVPPYGTIERTATGLTFTAQTRIVSASGVDLFSGEGSSTMQSMGSMEMGEFAFAIPLEGATATADEGGLDLDADGQRYRLIGLGPAAETLPKLLRSAGVEV